MGMDNIFKGFLVETNLDPKQDTVSLSAVTWILNLFGPDNVQKPWNYHKDFVVYLKRNSKTPHLFHMKDARFGQLSRCCAIVAYHWHDFQSFLDSHDYISNKLACLVRDAMNLEYVQVVIAVVASIGMQLISPFHATTIATDSNHSSLTEFLRDLYLHLSAATVAQGFFDLDTPAYPCVHENLFSSVIKQYIPEVVQAVRDIAARYLQDCVTLTEALLPNLALTLSRQRGGSYGFGDQPPEYPVFQQVAGNVDKTPVNNIEQERQCGSVDHLLKTRPSLDAASRSVILKGTSKLRKQAPANHPSFRKMGSAVKEIQRLKAAWSQRQMELRAAGLNSKEAQRLHIDQRKLAILDSLKQEGGPFTTAEEVESYLADESIPQDSKSKRMRKEVTFARDTSVSLPRAHSVFRIFNTSVKPRRLLSADEFGDNLKILLGKRLGRTYITLDEYRQAVDSLK